MAPWWTGTGRARGKLVYARVRINASVVSRTATTAANLSLAHFTGIRTRRIRLIYIYDLSGVPSHSRPIRYLKAILHHMPFPAFTDNVPIV
jgi:hypothetical protein